MKKIRAALKPKKVYLTKGSLQRISWLVKDMHKELLYSPTATEFIAKVEEYKEQPTALIVVPRALKNSKQDKVYGIPYGDSFYPDDLTFTFISLDIEEEEAAKDLKDKFVSSLTSARYSELNLNGSTYKLNEDEELTSYATQIPKEDYEFICNCYKDYPHDLLKQLQLYPNHNLVEEIESENYSLLNELIYSLGDKENYLKWDELTVNKLYGLFQVRPDSYNVSYASKALSAGPKLKYEYYQGERELPGSINQDLLKYLFPILDKIRNRSPREAKFYLSLFSRFALAVSLRLSDRWDVGFKKQISKRGNTFLNCKLSPKAESLWLKHIVKTDS